MTPSMLRSVTPDLASIIGKGYFYWPPNALIFHKVCAKVYLPRVNYDHVVRVLRIFH